MSNRSKQVASATGGQIGGDSGDGNGGNQSQARVRARDKLREFYKIAPTASTSSTSSSRAPGSASDIPPVPSTPGGKPGNPLDLDSSNFDSKKYLKRMLVEEGVAGLLSADNELVSSVRQIDGDMKTMVYENYSKFISATETIGKMSEDADYMDAEMAKLSKRVTDIAERTKAVDREFAQRRERIQRLSGEQKTMRRLQLLFDLPERLNKLISQGRFVEAAREWSNTKPLLEHYRQLGVFAGVENDGRQIMASVESTIWDRWQRDETDVREGAECASLLVLLQPERAPELWREYLAIQGKKNRECRQAALDRAYATPKIAVDMAGGTEFPTLEPVDGTGANTDMGASAALRIVRFNDEYLPIWSSLVIGFASQFVSPAGSGLLEEVSAAETTASLDTTPGKQARTKEKKRAGGDRAMSLLEATTEGTVVGLLSPLASNTQNQSPRKPAGHRVVGWQAMNAEELSAAQKAFSQHLKEWSSDYEFIVDSLLDFPDDANASNVRIYLAQLDALVGCIAAYPILARIGGLNTCVQRIATRWQERLVEGALHSVVRDMIERLEFYFDPSIGVPQLEAPTAPVPRRSSVSRHQRTLSSKSNGSQGSGNNHQRSGSVLSATWSVANAVERSAQFNNASNAASQSPLPFHTVSSGSGITGGSSRGLAHARAVSSAFEALSNVPSQPIPPGTLSLSPALAPFNSSASPQQPRLSRASTVNTINARHSIGPVPGTSSRSGTLRRTPHQRANSNAAMDLFDSPDDAPPQSRRSLSLRRASVRRYRPWLVGSVNRNAPLHVFLAEIESWLIQQILERVNPLLESVVQHYLDIEASQMLDEGEVQPQSLPLQTATRMRQTFIKTLDSCLDTWMSSWMPEAFLYSAMVVPVHGSRTYVEKSINNSAMAQLGMSTVGDPVSSLLLARFAVDFELTLTQSIYQLCEHAISILPEDSTNKPSAHSSAEASFGNMIAGQPGDTERMYSITAASIARADSMASAVSNSRRGTLGMRSGNALLSIHRAAHSAKWHSVAERLVKHFVMTVGQDISSDYLRIRLYDFSEESQQPSSGSVAAVSETWLSICRWMKQVEDDTNALFYDPVFSNTLKALENSSDGDGNGSGSGSGSNNEQATFISHETYMSPSGSGRHAASGHPALLHAHILSNIDRLFAERVDVFPTTVTPLTSGQILFHLAMQIIKTAIESLRLRPHVLRTATEYQQIVVDATFVRSWMLRYTGVAPDLMHLSDMPNLPPLGQPFVGEPRRRSSRIKLGQQGAVPTTPVTATHASFDMDAVINERDAQAIINLVDDWISSAKAFAFERTEPDPKIVDKIVLSAWMATYFDIIVALVTEMDILLETVVLQQTKESKSLAIPWQCRKEHAMAGSEQTPASNIYESKRWQSTFRRQLLGSKLKLGQVLTLLIGSQTVKFEVHAVEAAVDSCVGDVSEGYVGGTTNFDLRPYFQRQVNEENVVAGYESEVASLADQVRNYFVRKGQFRQLNIKPLQTVFVSGLSGIGKTSIIHAALERLEYPTIYANLGDIIINGSSTDFTEEYVSMALEDLANRARAAAPSVLVIDRVDVLNDSELTDDMDDIYNQFRKFADSIPDDVFLVLESSIEVSDMPAAVKKCDALQHSLVVPVPTLSRRELIVRRILYSLANSTKADNLPATQSSRTLEIDELAKNVANATAGYVARDIGRVCRQAFLRVLRESPNVSKNSNDVDALVGELDRLSINGLGILPKQSHFSESLQIVRPSQHLEFEGVRPTKRWSDIGGYEKTKQVLQRFMRLATAEKSSALGIKPPSGIMLYGPTGCGKTVMAQAMIGESGCNVIYIRGSELFSKYLGETEARLRRLFLAARAAAPCIVFMDEVDSIAAKREWSSVESGGPSLRVLSTLLNELDGVHETKGVIAVGCRFDQVVEVCMPSLSDRVNILHVLGQKSVFSGDVDVDKLAQMTEGYSGAALEQLLREAGLAAMRQNHDASEIRMADFIEGIEKIALI
ncbi:hypothetical protein LPJ73_000289 [Coemansia sp. RSA 2703]|nr:hypothetical protein LPJ73_000289 [Coemansia sp. RSA 2703]